MNTKLSNLLKDLPFVDKTGEPLPDDYNISTICMDSRTVVPNALFICIKGFVSDGHAYAFTAYEKGARVFVVEQTLPLPQDAYQIIVKNTRTALARLASAYYEFPAKRLRLIGLTGTKGKTTTSLYIRNILEEAGIPTGYIGTNGVIYDDIHIETANSTPESLLLQKYLYEMAEAGIRAVVLEVSSQGLWMHRVSGIRFDVCIFTNLSDDHIGTWEHPDMDHYKACKKKLFTNYRKKKCIVVCNQDDPETPYMTEGISSPIVGISTDPKSDAPYVGYDINSHLPAYGLTTTFRCRIHGKPFAHACTLPTVGEFNVKNALCAVATACEAFGVTPEAAFRTLSHTHVEGRFETLVFPSLPDVKFVIDYAHNGLSMAAALEALRACNPNRLICVFGSVGSRSKGRRAELAAAAGPRADLCILTSDNPNAENPLDILKEIDAAFPEGSCERELIVDRKEAIERAVEIAHPGDIILLAGKGHEHSQVAGGQVLPYNEKETLESVVMAQDGSLSDRMPY